MLMPSIFGNDFMNDFFGGFPYKSNGTMQTDVSETQSNNESSGIPEGRYQR